MVNSLLGLYLIIIVCFFCSILVAVSYFVTMKCLFILLMISSSWSGREDDPHIVGLSWVLLEVVLVFILTLLVQVHGMDSSQAIKGKIIIVPIPIHTTICSIKFKDISNAL